MFCYTENEQRKHYGSPVPYDEQEASKFWLQHYSNKLMLTFFLKNSTDACEKLQITKELAIADRKMHHWQRHPNFDLQRVTRETFRLKKEWEMK